MCYVNDAAVDDAPACESWQRILSALLRHFMSRSRLCLQGEVPFVLRENQSVT